MKKQLLSTALCLCMVMTLLPGTAWAADQGAKDSIADALAAEGLAKGDTFTVDGIQYTYGGQDSQAAEDGLLTLPDTATVYTAGNGYAAYTPAVTEGTPAKLVLNNASITGTIQTTGSGFGVLAVEVIGTCTVGAIQNWNGTLSITGSGSLKAYSEKVGCFAGNGDLTVDIDGALEATSTAGNGFSCQGNLGKVSISAASIKVNCSSAPVYAAGAEVCITAETGDITLEDTRGSASCVVKGGNGVTLNAPNGAITVIGGQNGLEATGKNIFVTANGNITITGASSCGIYNASNVSVRSDNGSIAVTPTVGIGHGVSQANTVTMTAPNGAVTLSSAGNFSYAAISIDSLSVTAGKSFTSESACGISAQGKPVTITAPTVDISATTDSNPALACGNLTISNGDATPCTRVSIVYKGNTAAGLKVTGNQSVAAIYSDNLLIRGNDNGNAITIGGGATLELQGTGYVIGKVSTSENFTKDETIQVIEDAAVVATPSGALDLSSVKDGTNVYLPKGGGVIIWVPDTSNNTLTLSGATLDYDIKLPTGSCTLVLKGTNSTGVISESSSEPGTVLTVAADSDASLTTSQITVKSITGDTAALNGVVTTDNALMTVYGTISLNFNGTVLNTDKLPIVIDKDAMITVNANVAFVTKDSFTNNGTINIANGATLDLSGCSAIAQGSGSIVNNGTLKLPESTEVDFSRLTGNGLVIVGADTYLNDGTKLHTPTDALDFSGGTTGDTTLTDNGYTFTGSAETGYTLTLGNLYMDVGEKAAITLPSNGNVTIVLDGKTTLVSGGAYALVSSASLTISGTGTLNATGSTAAIYAKDGITLTGTEVKSPAGAAVGQVSEYYSILSGNSPAATVTIGEKTVVPTPTPDQGNGGASGSSGSSGGSSSGSSTTTSTVSNADGSTTTTVTNKTTGTVKETTKYPDGAIVTVETKKDGTATTTDKQANGVITISKTNEDGKAVDITVTVPDSVTDAVQVQIPTDLGKTDGTVSAEITYTDGAKETVTGAYADGKVTLTVTGSATIKILDDFVPLVSELPFTDVPAGSWAHDSVAYVYEKGIFNGVTATMFNPNADTTREQMWMVLARMDGQTPSTMDEARAWAMEHNISDGTNAKNAVTREQFVTLLWRFAGEPAAENTLASFSDAASVAEYAQQAMCWATEKGLITGMTDGSIAPQNTATRAQVATILARYDQM